MFLGPLKARCVSDPSARLVERDSGGEGDLCLLSTDPCVRFEEVIIGGSKVSCRSADLCRLALGGWIESSTLALWRLRGFRVELDEWELTSGANMLQVN